MNDFISLKTVSDGFLFFSLIGQKYAENRFQNSGTIDATYNETLTLTIKKLSLNDLMKLCSHNCIYIDLNDSPSTSEEIQSKLSDSITSQSSQLDESDWTLHVSTTSDEEDEG